MKFAFLLNLFSLSYIYTFFFQKALYCFIFFILKLAVGNQTYLKSILIRVKYSKFGTFYFVLIALVGKELFIIYNVILRRSVNKHFPKLCFVHWSHKLQRQSVSRGGIMHNIQYFLASIHIITPLQVIFFHTSTNITDCINIIYQFT